jgi:hypothetical protein
MFPLDAPLSPTVRLIYVMQVGDVNAQSVVRTGRFSVKPSALSRSLCGDIDEVTQHVEEGRGETARRRP